jgi:hypothetical protein
VGRNSVAQSKKSKPTDKGTESKENESGKDADDQEKEGEDDSIN